MSDADDFDDPDARHAPLGDDDDTLDQADRLTLSIGGFEGPLDVLLDLAQRQKVDLRRISVLELAEQYLAFVERARSKRIDLAADYLVMAAWLAYLKSRLLLPEPAKDDGPSGAELADALAHRLARLEAMQRAGAALMARPQLGRDFFARGHTEGPPPAEARRTGATLADLLKAYARVQTRETYRPLAVETRSEVLALDDARGRLERLIGRKSAQLVGWQRLDALLPDGWTEAPAKRRSAIASSFAAALELAKQGEVELSQDGAFAPLHLRATKPGT
ncbi:MAG: ScpA family protein [Pseudomonadota bacterium]